MKIRIVCATREDPRGFAKTALGRSLALYRKDIVDLRLFDRNTQGLSIIYNIAIAEAAQSPAVMVFVHDDVFLVDFYWIDYLHQALTRFDVVGLAGNKRRVPHQPGWCFIGRDSERFIPDSAQNLTGVVGHGESCPPATISYFGPPGQPVKLLDGLLLAARSETLLASGLRFDERFQFHFYDMDFCRQAEVLGLKMGTWPITVVHQSAGNFASASWQSAYATYLEKWKE